VNLRKQGGWAIAIVLAATTIAACGKKGAPLPPAARVPTQAGDVTATRIGDEVYVRFTVPAANVDGQKPADVARVEVYAITADREPVALDDAEEIRDRSTLVATEVVRRPLPAPPPIKPGEPEPPPLPAQPGVDQGAVVVVREKLTPAMRTPVALPATGARSREDEGTRLPGPLIAPVESNEPKRYYYVVPVSARGRYGPGLPYVPIPLGDTSSAPSAPALSHDETTLTIKWTPPKDVRGSQSPSYPDVIPSKPIALQAEPTFYDVYEVPSAPPAPSTPPPLSVPTPLTPAPVGELQLIQPITTLGVERCFFVRSVDVVGGYHVRGPASPTTCIEFKDTFPPPAPAALAAVASGGAINLIWDPSTAPDLAGYLVLRGEAPGATLTPLAKEPVDKTAFVDSGVRAGVTYVYAVVAVDKAGNRSGESNRVEETARQ
jgi:predicted small lipoprotein YifL